MAMKVWNEEAKLLLEVMLLHFPNKTLKTDESPSELLVLMVLEGEPLASHQVIFDWTLVRSMQVIEV